MSEIIKLEVTRHKMGNYDDIINLPHHVSTKHPRMSALDRAAQFSPFAALTGYEAAIKETARLNEIKQLDENKKEDYGIECPFPDYENQP